MSAIAEYVARLERQPGPPPRTELQRLRALEHANEIRSYRAELKQRIKHGEVDVVDLLVAEPDERIATMKIFDLLLAMPTRGRARVNDLLKREQISPSKTVGGLSRRQRVALVARLRHDRARPRLFDDVRLPDGFALPHTQPPGAAGAVRSRTPASGADRA